MIGRTLAHYEIVESLGAGETSSVYRARSTQTGQYAALKLLEEEANADPESLACLSREAHLLSRLDHPNIARVYGNEHRDGYRFIPMGLVEGETLADMLRRGPGIEPAVCPVCSGDSVDDGCQRLTWLELTGSWV